jgi:hypothetical protein
MTREELLKTGLVEEKNVTTIITNILAKDAKFLKRAKRDLEDQLDEASDKLEERLTSNIPIDASTVLSVYGKIKELEEQLELYASFKDTYFSEEK